MGPGRLGAALRASALTLLAVGPVHADPTTPPVEPAEPGPSARYPVDLAARPLLVPRGVLEVTLPVALEVTDRSVTDLDQVYVEPRLRAGWAAGEVEGAVGVTWFELGDRPDGVAGPARLRGAMLAGRYRLTPERAIGLELGATTPTEPVRSYRALAWFQQRFRLAPRAAAVAGAGLGIERELLDTAGPVESYLPAVAEGRLRVLAQVSSTIAVEANGALAYRRHLAGARTTPIGIDEPLELHVGFGATFALGPTLDLFVALPAVDVEGRMTVAIGISARRLP